MFIHVLIHGDSVFLSYIFWVRVVTGTEGQEGYFLYLLGGFSNELSKHLVYPWLSSLPNLALLPEPRQSAWFNTSPCCGNGSQTCQRG